MPDVNIELNFFYMHYKDAKKFAEWASEECEGDINPSIYVRHAVISTVFASEALINRVLVEFSRDADVAKILERESILDKWYLAPFLCSGDQEPTAFLKRGKRPIRDSRS